MKLKRKNIAEEHRWFAWHPVHVISRDAAGPSFKLVWLRRVTRKAVALQGALVWAYSL